MFPKWRRLPLRERKLEWARPVLSKNGTKPPIALLVTDTNVSLWTLDVNADGTMKTLGNGTPVLLTNGPGTVAKLSNGATGATADTHGSPSPPGTTELEGADQFAASQTAYQFIEKDRDYLVILPGDMWGINPQRTGLDKPYGIYLDGGRNVLIVSGEFDLKTNWLAQAGGVGINRLQSAPFTADSGGGYIDEVQRCFRIREHTGVLHIEGVKFGGKYLFECIDYSNSTTASRQIQRCQFGDATNPVRNQQIQNVASVAAMTSGTAAAKVQPLDIWNVTNGHAYRFNGGDPTVLANYTDLGAGAIPVQHSGGDCIQDWKTVAGVHRFADNTFHTRFQAHFHSWNDQLTSTPTTTPSYDIRRSRIHSYLTAQGPWLLYVGKGGGFGNVGTTNLQDVWITTHGYTATLSSLTRFFGISLTASGTDAISAWTDGSAAADANLKVSGLNGVRAANATFPVYGADKKGGDYAADYRVGRNYRPGVWFG